MTNPNDAPFNDQEIIDLYVLGVDVPRADLARAIAIQAMRELIMLVATLDMVETDPHPTVRMSAAAQLGELPAPILDGVTETLSNVAENDIDLRVRDVAATSLGRLLERQAIYESEEE